MAYRIRTATMQDAAKILEVYAPYVLDTTVSFELEVPSVDEYAVRVARAIDHYTFLVVEEADEESGARRIAGFASYGPFGHRAAYRWSGETSIYLEDDLTGQGVGEVLLDCLERIMVAGGITNSEACICSENTGSIEFHKRHGYRVVGEFVDCASKFGRWLGIQWLEKHIADHVENPEAPHAPDTAACAAAVAEANERLRELATR